MVSQLLVTGALARYWDTRKYVQPFWNVCTRRVQKVKIHHV